MAVNLHEIEEAERLVARIELDYRHPAMDPKHPNHEPSKRALDELKSKVAQTRAKIDAERHFKF